MISSAPNGTATSSGRKTPPAPAAVAALRVVAGRAGLSFGVRVSPSSKQTRLQGLHGDRLKVQVAAPPEHDRANQELVAALASWLQMSPAGVHIERGRTGRDKTVEVSGISEAQLRERVARALGEQ